MSGTVRLWLLEFSKDSASACITVFALTVRLQIEQMTAQFRKSFKRLSTASMC